MGFFLLMMSFGIPFIHEGTEFGRTKHMDYNSYRSGDYVNEIDWSFKHSNSCLFNYVKKLIEIRKQMKFFTNYDKSEIEENLVFYNLTQGAIGYEINDIYEKIKYVYFINPSTNDVETAQSSEKHYKNRHPLLSQRLAMLPEHDLVAKDFIDLYRSGIGIGQTLFSFLLPLGLIWLILSLMGGFLPPENLLLIFAVVTGVISSTMYTWLTEFDAIASYMFLPLSVSSVIKAKIESFTLLQAVPVIFLTGVALYSGTAAYIPHALVVSLCISFFALSVLVRLCGLSPTTLIYNARIFLTYMLLIGPLILALIILTFTSPLFAFAGILLVIPSWYFIHSGFEKWDNTDFAGF